MKGCKMRKTIKTANFTNEGKLYTGKREVFLIDDITETAEAVKKNKLNTTDINMVNAKIVVEVQNSMRTAMKIKHGLKQISAGGVAVDLSAVESV